MNDDSETLQLDERYSTSRMMVMRPWEIVLFENLRHIEDKRVFG